MVKLTKRPVRFKKSFKKFNHRTLEKILKSRLKLSGIRDIDFKLYVTIAEYCIIKCQVNIFQADGLDKFLQSEYAKKMTPTQVDKASYVLQILYDWRYRKLSEKCQGIRVYCEYCHSLADLVDSKVIYASSMGNIYLCKNYPSCDAYVGVHKGDNWPKGTLANEELRDYRKNLHQQFDPLWKGGTMKRSEAYAFLQKNMGLQEYETHIAMFNLKQCTHAEELIFSFIDRKKSMDLLRGMKWIPT